MKELYDYVFYRFYKFSEAAPSRWMSEWKASLCMDIMVFSILMSIFIYYKTFINNNSDLANGNFFILLMTVICAFNYFIFNHTDRWKSIVRKYDKLPKQENRKKGVLAWVLILAIISNLIFSFYCLDRKAERNQTGPYSKEYIEQQSKIGM